MAEGFPDHKSKGGVKHDWYQTEKYVVITLLIKNLREEQVKIEFSKNTLILNICDYNGENIEKSFKLAHEIDSKQCNYKITPVKIEIKLTKVEGIKWDALEVTPNTRAAKGSGASSGPPAYPTSKKGKDWNAIEKDITKQEASEKPEGEEALNKLFQEIYGKGNDEVKKAMNKSFIESGGTVLSTNWGEISKQKVEVKPPDGLEWKKW